MLFSGYRLRPDLTAQARDGRWFVTSDLGSIGPSGELLVRGRADDVINTGGEKVVAAEVEAVLGTCAGVRDAVVVGRPDAEWGELVTAVVVPADPSAPPALADIRAHVRESCRPTRPRRPCCWCRRCRCYRPVSQTGKRCGPGGRRPAQRIPASRQVGARDQHGNNWPR